MAHSKNGLIAKQSKALEAKYDTVALCISRLLDDMAGTGNTKHVGHLMGELISDPQRLGGVCLTLLGMVRNLSNSGRPNNDGFGALITYLVEAIPDHD